MIASKYWFTYVRKQTDVRKYFCCDKGSFYSMFSMGQSSH